MYYGINSILISIIVISSNINNGVNDNGLLMPIIFY